jgi:hypothetical protein
MAVWPNGLRTRPNLSSLWKEYSGRPAADHFGLDMYGFTYNHAIAAGTISKIGYNTFGGGGHEVYLKLDNGDVILYYHNDRNLLVKVGERAPEGSRLGVQSNSGKTYGTHLHLEVWIDGYRSRRVDPLPYITALVGSSPAGGTGTPINNPEEEEEMKASQMHYKDRAGKTIRCLFVPGTAYFLAWQENGATIANGFATSQQTANSILGTKSMVDAIKSAAQALLPASTVSSIGDVTVTIDAAELTEGIAEAVNDNAAQRLAN